MKVWSMPLIRVMPINQFLLYFVDSVIIFGNLYLYRFLTQNTVKRTKGKTRPWSIESSPGIV